MMDKETEIKELLKIAKRRLSHAASTVQAGDYDVAVHDYYLVVFYLMKALTLNEGFAGPKRAGYVAAFHRLIVNENKVPRYSGRLVHRLSERAIQGMYKYRHISRGETLSFGRFLAEFVDLAQNQLTAVRRA
jgi:uncharacterized protein (UPF0332 family)